MIIEAMQQAIDALKNTWGPDVKGIKAVDALRDAIRQYQAEREWVGLTPADYDSMRPRVPGIVNDFSFTDVAAIVEAKLKEKNT